jgi:hypothetical protein
VSDPVKIVISETREGNAIDEEQRRIEQLHKAADHYDQTGNSVAAKTARAEATELQKKQLGSRLAKEAEARAAGNGDAADHAAREAKEMERTLSLQRKGMGYSQAALTARRQLTQETAQKAEAAALRAANIHGAGYGHAGGLLGGNARMIGDLLDTLTGGQGWVMKAMAVDRIPHMLEGLKKMTGGAGATAKAVEGAGAAGAATGAAAGEAAAGVEAATGALAGLMPLLLGLGAVAGVAAIGGQYAMFRRGEKEQDYQEQNKMREEQAGDERSQEISASPLGSSSGSFQSEIGDETEIKKREADRGRLAHARKHAWFGLKDRLANLTGGRWKTQEQRDEIDNENEINRATRDKGASKKTLKEQWKVGGAIDEQILEHLSEHSVAGIKKATVDTAKKTWIAAYRKAAQEGAGDSEAMKIADLTTKQADWERAQARGAGLVNARTGNAGVAAAARWADTGIVGPGMDALLAETKNQTAEMRAHLQALTATQTRVDQRGKPLKP